MSSSTALVDALPGFEPRTPKSGIWRIDKANLATPFAMEMQATEHTILCLWSPDQPLVGVIDGHREHPCDTGQCKYADELLHFTHHALTS